MQSTAAVKTLRIFQSTRPLWGATLAPYWRGRGEAISIHAPLVGRDPIPCPSTRRRPWNFNPRAPCGARRARTQFSACTARFQSTRPLWGATYWSIGDRKAVTLFQSTRPLWGATAAGTDNWSGGWTFQSTRPLWGATDRYSVPDRGTHNISIHAPLVGRDCCRQKTQIPSS